MSYNDDELVEEKSFKAFGDEDEIGDDPDLEPIEEPAPSFQFDEENDDSDFDKDH